MCSKAEKHSDKKKHKVRAKYYSQSSSSEKDQSPVPIKKSTKPQQAPFEPEHQQDSTDPVFYREVDLSDLPSQYAEEVETFREILDLPDPRENLPRSSTIALGLDDKKGQQELRPRGPSAMFPLNPILKDAFDSDASRVRDTRYLTSFSTDPQFGIFGVFGRRRDPACLQNGGAPIVSRESFNFIIMKTIFGRFFSKKCYFT